jgi:nucleoside-diphosphate-sugar epimerase
VRVLVVGGTGFIGGPTVRRLVALGHDVAVFNRGETPSGLPAGVAWIRGERARIVDHAARVRAWKPGVVVDSFAYAEADVRGVVDAVRGVAERLVVLSSFDVYRAYDRLTRARGGPAEATPIGEDAPLREIPFPRRRWTAGPGDVMWDYDKIPVERAALSNPDLPGTVLRLPAVYGPGDLRRHRVGRYVARMDARPATLDLDARLSRWRWTRGYVDDVAEAIALASVDPRAAGRTYNVGETAPLTEGDWVRAIARVAGYSGAIVDRAREGLPASVAGDLDTYDFDHDLVLDTNRIHSELGWRPRAALDDALAASIAWEREAVRVNP